MSCIFLLYESRFIQCHSTMLLFVYKWKSSLTLTGMNAGRDCLHSLNGGFLPGKTFSYSFTTHTPLSGIIYLYPKCSSFCRFHSPMQVCINLYTIELNIKHNRIESKRENATVTRTAVIVGTNSTATKRFKHDDKKIVSKHL